MRERDTRTMNSNGAPFSFPSLPIVTPDPPRLTTRQKYGGLFYFGLAGLALLIMLVGWFAHGAWSMRTVWYDVYVLHAANRTEGERISAAFALSRDPRVNQRQRWDICLRRPLPALARYVLAESLSGEAASADPRAYALAVARSPGWADWLRLLLVRPMAYAATEGVRFPGQALEELMRQEDPAIRLWASFVVSQADEDPGKGLRTMEIVCEGGQHERDLACLLLEAARLKNQPGEQVSRLDKATLWLRRHHPVRVADGANHESLTGLRQRRIRYEREQHEGCRGEKESKF